MSPKFFSIRVLVEKVFKKYIPSNISQKHQAQLKNEKVPGYLIFVFEALQLSLAWNDRAVGGAGRVCKVESYS